jgi:hypothetical protein
MNGTISAANQRRQRYAINTSTGYTIADLIDGELNINNEVAGTLDEHGDTTLRNLTTGDMVDVRIEAFYATQQSAAQLLAK